MEKSNLDPGKMLLCNTEQNPAQNRKEQAVYVSIFIFFNLPQISN